MPARTGIISISGITRGLVDDPIVAPHIEPRWGCTVSTVESMLPGY